MTGKNPSQETYAEIYGKGSVAVLFFHGLFDSLANPSIKKVRDALSKEYKVIAFDFPGHGKSKGDINDFSLKETIIEAEKIIKRIKFKKIFVVGFSFGCYPAILFANKNQYAKGIILFNPASDFLKLVGNKKSEKELEKYTRKQEDMNLISRIKLFLEILPINLYKIVDNTDIPFFVVHSIDDELVPVEQTKKLERQIKKGEVIYITGENHACDKIGKIETEVIPKTLEFIKNIATDSAQ